MSKERVIDSVGRIDDAIIRKVNAARNDKHQKIQFRRWISLAACFALILGLVLTAGATNGTVSNLLAPLFGGAQTEIVDEIGVPIGASASANGYTLTVDAIIGDRYSVMIAYTLSRDDGQPIPENIEFKRVEIRASGYRTPIEIDAEDPSIAHFHERWMRNEPLLDRTVTASFSELFVDGEKETEIAEGPWEITFTLRYPDTSAEIPVGDLHVCDETGKKYQVKKMILSALGVHMDVIEYDPVFAEVSFSSFKTALLLKDGSEVPLEGGGGGGRMTEGDKTRKFSYYGEFEIPIPREEIKAIRICDTVFEMDNLD